MWVLGFSHQAWGAAGFCSFCFRFVFMLLNTETLLDTGTILQVYTHIYYTFCLWCWLRGEQAAVEWTREIKCYFQPLRSKVQINKHQTLSWFTVETVALSFVSLLCISLFPSFITLLHYITLHYSCSSKYKELQDGSVLVLCFWHFRSDSCSSPWEHQMRRISHRFQCIWAFRLHRCS